MLTYRPLALRPSVLSRFLIASAMLVGIVAFGALRVEAHFLWLLPPSDGESQVRLVFSEGPEPDDPDLLDRLGDISLQIVTDQSSLTIPMKKANDALIAQLASATTPGETKFMVRHTYGVMERGGSTFCLEYQATAVSQIEHSIQTGEIKDGAGLVIAVNRVDEFVEVSLKVNGKPVTEGKLSLIIDGDKRSLHLGNGGVAVLEEMPSKSFALLASAPVAQTGTFDGKEYTEVRYYATLVVGSVATQERNVSNVAVRQSSLELPALPEPITSFGAAIQGTTIMIAGGHTGESHSYSISEQSNQFLMAEIPSAKEWKISEISDRVQGLGMVAVPGGVVRIGGFTARNAYGEKHQLESLSTVERFDMVRQVWEKMPSLPEPRSSHDAAIIGNTMYVVGGWRMAPEQPTQWHDTAWSLNLDASQLEWEPLTAPTFHRRALATVGYRGKLYVIGGMNEQGGPTCETEVYDPATKSWSHGPSLIGKPMAGFGAAACVYQDRLYVSTVEGQLLVLDDDGDHWDIVGQTPSKRFFHRMIPCEHGILVVGGSNPDGDRPTLVELLTP